MKVLDLKCAQGHAFEGWFASQADFDDQKARHLVECPMCGNADVERQLSAPRLSLGRAVAPAAEQPAAAPTTTPAAPATALSPEAVRARAARMMEMARELLQKTEDVGERFVEEARRMHYGESEQRGIRGTASVEDAAALVEEGVPVVALVLPEGLKGPLH